MSFVRIQNSFYHVDEILRVHSNVKNKSINVYFKDTSQWNGVGIALYQYESIESVTEELNYIELQLRKK